MRTRLRSVVSESTSLSWVCQPRRRATETKGNSWGSRQAHSWRPRVIMMPLCGGKDGVARDHMGLRLGMGTDLAGERESAEAARDGDGLMAVSVDHLRGKKPGGAGPSVQHR